MEKCPNPFSFSYARSCGRKILISTPTNKPIFRGFCAGATAALVLRFNIIVHFFSCAFSALSALPLRVSALASLKLLRKLCAISFGSFVLVLSFAVLILCKLYSSFARQVQCARLCARYCAASLRFSCSVSVCARTVLALPELR